MPPFFTSSPSSHKDVEQVHGRKRAEGDINNPGQRGMRLSLPPPQAGCWGPGRNGWWFLMNVEHVAFLGNLQDLMVSLDHKTNPEVLIIMHVKH